MYVAINKYRLLFAVLLLENGISRKTPQIIRFSSFNHFDISFLEKYFVILHFILGEGCFFSPTAIYNKVFQE